MHKWTYYRNHENLDKSNYVLRSYKLCSMCCICIDHKLQIHFVEKWSNLPDFPEPREACNLAGIKMLTVTGAGLQALQSCHVPRDDGTQWRLLLVSEQTRNGCLFNALWFNFLLFLAVRGGLVNLSYFFIMFVHSSVPVNETPQRHGRARAGDRIYCPSPFDMWTIKEEAG